MIWIIRHMAAADIASVLALEQQTPEAPHWRLDDYERRIGDDSAGPLQRTGFVAESEGRLLGFSVGKLVAGTCELESIAVIPEARGQGIGRTLLQAVTDWAVIHEAVRIELEVRASNSTAIRIYERAGLRCEGLRPDYFKFPPEDAVLMGRSLVPVENLQEKRIATGPPKC